MTPTIVVTFESKGYKCSNWQRNKRQKHNSNAPQQKTLHDFVRFRRTGAAARRSVVRQHALDRKMDFHQRTFIWIAFDVKPGAIGLYQRFC